MNKKPNFDSKSTEELLADRKKAKDIYAGYMDSFQLVHDIDNEMFRRENDQFSGRYFMYSNKYRVTWMHVRKPVYEGYFDVAVISQNHGSDEYTFSHDCHMMIDIKSKGKKMKEMSKAEFIVIADSIMDEMLKR